MSRFWLALIYALAMILAQGGHDHGQSKRPAREAENLCEQGPRAHLCGHVTPGQGHPATDCLACQFRANPQALADSTTAPQRMVVTAAAEIPRTSALPDPVARPTCRAPPRA